MDVLVPYDVRNPKTRLSAVFDAVERHAFARAMLDDVLDSLQRAGHDPTVLATAPVDCEPSVTVDERPLTAAVNSALEDAVPTGIVMADLPLVTPVVLDRLFGATGDVVIAPGIGGGTNALVVRHPDFRVDYHAASFRDHYDQAAEKGLDVSVVDSFKLAVDIDEREDLLEVLLHGTGSAREWLTEAGITVDSSGKYPKVSLSGENS
jgi:2-phospho-L-lactate guanylyltransferase